MMMDTWAAMVSLIDILLMLRWLIVLLLVLQVQCFWLATLHFAASVWVGVCARVHVCVHAMRACVCAADRSNLVALGM